MYKFFSSFFLYINLIKIITPLWAITYRRDKRTEHAFNKFSQQMVDVHKQHTYKLIERDASSIRLAQSKSKNASKALTRRQESGSEKE